MRKVTAVFTMALLGVTVVGVQAESPDLSPISIRVASGSALRGFNRTAVGSTETVYIGAKTALRGSQVTFAERREGSGLEMSLENGAGARLQGLMNKTGADRVVVYVGIRPIATSKITFDGDNVVLTGLSSDHEDRISRVLNGETAAAGPMLTLVPSRTVLKPGESVTFDIFVSGVSDLRVYQVAIAVAGGSGGNLSRIGAEVAVDRPDYVFASKSKVEAVDQVGGRLGATLISGGVDVTRPAYVGSFTFQASADATGTFAVNASMDDNTFLRNSANRPIDFFPGTTAMIKVGKTARLGTSGK